MSCASLCGIVRGDAGYVDVQAIQARRRGQIQGLIVVAAPGQVGRHFRHVQSTHRATAVVEDPHAAWTGAEHRAFCVYLHPVGDTPLAGASGELGPDVTTCWFATLTDGEA